MQWAKFRIAAVAVSALIILGVLVYLLSGGTWLKPKTYLITYLPDSSGLERNADVQLNGVQIGKVESLTLTRLTDPNRVVEVRLKIQEAYLKYIPEDSTTEVDSANFLGDKYVNITMGRSPQPIRAGGEVRYKPPSNFAQNIDLTQFETQLRTIDQVIRDIQAGRGPLGQFVVSDALYRKFLAGAENVERKIRAATATQSALGQFLFSATMIDNLGASLKQLDDRLARLQSEPLLRDSSQYVQLRDQVAQLRDAVVDLQAGRNPAGQLLTSDATYLDLTKQVASWMDAIDALNYGEGGVGHLLSSAQAYESLSGSLRELAATVKDFREHPQKFLRFKIF
jgi:ABC-type transporter Mla subunit MlaD